jgi:hypothetical protein
VYARGDDNWRLSHTLDVLPLASIWQDNMGDKTCLLVENLPWGDNTKLFFSALLHIL